MIKSANEKLLVTNRFLSSFSIYLFVFLCSSVLANETENSKSIQIIKANNLAADSKLSSENHSVIILYVAAPDCPFCKKLEREVLIPFIKSGDYKNKAILRKINWRSSESIIDFNGENTTPIKLLKFYDLKITPTLLFLDSRGNEVYERSIGYSGNEFFWYYLDVAIEKSNLTIANH